MIVRDDSGASAGIATRRALQGAAPAVSAGAVVVAIAGLTLFRSPAPMVVTAVLFGTVTLLVLSLFARLRPHAGFGAANTITLGRTALVAVLAGYAVDPPPGDDADWWIAAVFAAVALLLDGVDGWMARRRGLATAFGARFDMEIDALAALVLSVTLWRADRAGAWIILIGALRYMFLVAGWVFTTLRRPLPPRRRRRAASAIQAALLALCLVPSLPVGAAPMLGAIALGLTALSFLIDTLWLIRRRDDQMRASS